MLKSLRSFLELIRFSHTLFALPFALSSAVLAWQDKPFHFLDLLGILLCMVFARSVAMAFNRIVDRKIDADNPRTRSRHLPAGLLSLRMVILFALLCSLGFVASTLLFIVTSDNYWPIILSGPVLLFICAYSLTKRFTSLAHFWLGASLFLAPVCAWIALLGFQTIQVPVVLGLAVLFWVAGFDILYACQDVDFDKEAKLHSVPARWGVANSLRIAMLSHLAMLICLLSLFWLSLHLEQIYLIGVGLVAILILYQHWLVSPSDLSRVNQAFFQVNAIISLGLFLIVLIQTVVKI